MRSPVLRKSSIPPQVNRRLWRVVAQQLLISVRSMMLLGIVCLGCGIGGVVLVHYAKHHSYFAATDIVVSTDGTLTQDEIKQWGGLARGMNIIALDVQAAEQRLVQHPWVQTAVITREFPQRIHLTIQERHPIAFIRSPEAAYLDGNGESFVTPVSGVHDLPYISGLERVPLETRTAQTVLAEMRLCLSLLREWGAAVSEIHWDDQRGYTLFLSDRQVVIRLGQKIRPAVFVPIQRVLESWPQDRRATVFDTRFTDQIVASPLPFRPYRGKDMGFTRTL